MERLLEVMRRLRGPGGCPWDKVQDIRSLRPYLVEETYEVLDEMDAVANGGSWQGLAEELGDLLFQIVFHAQLAEEQGHFRFADIATAIADKLERRHPHVFQNGEAKDAEAVLQNWAKLKAEERKKKTGKVGSVLTGVPSAAPALQRAERLTEKAARIGFDWKNVAGPRAKIDEELAELDEAIGAKNAAAIEHELGDVLFSVVNVARHVGCAPEDALRAANHRFTERFQHVESQLEARGVPFGEASNELMNTLWEQAKRQ
jgi:nucleoside triphosphate diphosphatase